jgi:hypothetical protein
MATKPTEDEDEAAVVMVCSQSFAADLGDGQIAIIGQGQRFLSTHAAVKLCPERFVPAGG